MDTYLVQMVDLGWIVWFTSNSSNHSKNFTQCSTGIGEAPQQFLSSLEHFWVNRAIHPKCTRIGQFLFYESSSAYTIHPKCTRIGQVLFYESSKACVGLVCDFWCVLMFWFDLVTSLMFWCPTTVSTQFFAWFCSKWNFLFKIWSHKFKVYLFAYL